MAVKKIVNFVSSNPFLVLCRKINLLGRPDESEGPCSFHTESVGDRSCA
jgi:hypothetical protein